MSKAELSSEPISVSALLAFSRAAELGSFARAARALGVTPAAIGQSVARLERGFGVELLARTTRRMTLTAEGRRLVARASSLIAELSEIRHLFDDQRGVVAGPIHVSAPLGFARRHLLPILVRFAEANPAVALSLDASDAIRDLVADRVDVAFRIVRPLEGNLTVVRVSRLAPVTLASPGYLRRHGTPLHPDDVSEHACVAYRHPGTDAVEPLRFRVRGHDVPVQPRARLTVNDVDLACEAAAAGLGVAQPPQYYVAAQLARGSLVPILERYAPAPWSLYLCYPAARQLPTRLRAFIDFTRSALADAHLG